MPYVLLLIDENARDVCSVHLGNNSKPPNHVSHVPAMIYFGYCQLEMLRIGVAQQSPT